MQTFKMTSAQGDVYFAKADKLPDGLLEQSPDGDELIITHSETGHHHVMVLDRKDAQPAARLYSTDDPLKSWLLVNRPVSLDHRRDNHTHESIMFEPGVYRVFRQRQPTPNGWKRVVD